MKTIIRSFAVMITTAIAIFTCQTAKAQKVIELTSEEFNKKVYNIEARELVYLGTQPAIVDFTAIWCGPCRSITPILEDIAKEYKDDIIVYKVDVDKCKDIARAFGISSIPAILYVPSDGEPTMTVGSRNKNRFKEEIHKYLLKEDK